MTDLRSSIIILDRERGQSRPTWNGWFLDSGQHTLSLWTDDVRDLPTYVIDLGKIGTPADALEQIFTLTDKTPVPADIDGLVRAIREVGGYLEVTS